MEKISFRVEKEIKEEYEFVKTYDEWSDVCDLGNGRTKEFEIHPSSLFATISKLFKENNMPEAEFIRIDNSWYIDFKSKENKILWVLKFGKNYVGNQLGSR